MVVTFIFYFADHTFLFFSSLVDKGNLLFDTFFCFCFSLIVCILPKAAALFFAIFFLILFFYLIS